MKKILIIEDDRIIAGIYGTKYSAAGFETKTASDGEEGLQMLATFKPDLVHLDLLVPKVNGVEIIKHIRSHPELKSLPIVVLSNTYQNHLVKAAMAAGATELLSKAICTPKVMLDIVNKLRARLPEAAAAASPDEAGTDADAAFQAETRRAFLERAPRILAGLSARVQALVASETDAARASEMSELCRAAHSLAGNAGAAGFKEMSQMSGALEALLKELLEKPKRVTPSSLKTIADTSDFLAVLLQHATEPGTDSETPAIVLIVDDEVMSRRAVSLAVARLNIAAISVDDPQIALRLIEENRFSLIFLDVDMPGMNGFDVCAELRKLPANKTTPVVFVTSADGFENRDRAVSSGGDDLIAKPFLSMELAVKALTHILKNQRPRAAETA